MLCNIIETHYWRNYNCWLSVLCITGFCHLCSLGVEMVSEWTDKEVMQVGSVKNKTVNIHLQTGRVGKGCRLDITCIIISPWFLLLHCSLFCWKYMIARGLKKPAVLIFWKCHWVRWLCCFILKYSMWTPMNGCWDHGSIGSICLIPFPLPSIPSRSSVTYGVCVTGDFAAPSAPHCGVPGQTSHGQELWPVQCHSCGFRSCASLLRCHGRVQQETPSARFTAGWGLSWCSALTQVGAIHGLNAMLKLLKM